MTRLHWLLVFFFASILLVVRAADPGTDYLEPKLLTGTIYIDAKLKQALFTFRRTATNDGPVIQVLREFNLPDGKLAARERVEYEGGKLKSFTLEDLQSSAKGSATVQSVGGEERINFNYMEGSAKKSGGEKVVPDILISDMVGPFIVAHWKELASGATVKCRMIAMARAETVGFKFFKESETTWQGKPVVLVKMEPSSFIIARLVAPLHFLVEKDGEHRVLQYTGRTTPKIQSGGKWEDLDAVSVFDWK